MKKLPARFFVDEIFKDITQKKRKFLLVYSLILIAVIKGEVVPSKIPSLGIDLSLTNQNSLLLFLGVIVLYFIIGFAIYSLSDYFSWKINFISSVAEYFRETGELSHEEAMGGIIAPGYNTEKLVYRNKFALIAKAIFDFALPILFGFYSLFVLYNKIF